VLATYLEEWHETNRNLVIEGSKVVSLWRRSPKSELQTFQYGSSAGAW